MSPQDNVTPFRPRRPPPRPKRPLNLQSHRGKAVMAQTLALICFAATYFLPAPPLSFIGLGFGVAALAIAASNRIDGMPWARTHHEHAMRTIIIGAASLTLLTALQLIDYAPLFIVIYWGRIGVCAWAGLRAAIGVALAIIRRPIPHPKGLLI
ncbi:MAG: hypothetical protein AB7L65_05065 [Hyphomonadaceae bacterium]